MSGSRGAAYAVALAAAGGVLCFLGFLGFGLWPLSLACLAVLWRAIDAAGAGRIAPAALVGFVYGAVAHAGGFHWMWRIVDVFLDGNVFAGAVLWTLDASWFGLRFALYAVLYTLARRRGWPAAIAGVAPLLLVEWLYPALFPVHLGHALSGWMVLVQVSDLGGPLLVTALLGLVNAALYEAWRCWRGRAGIPWATWTAAVLALAGAWLYGTARTAAIERRMADAPEIRVGIVQGNLGVFEKGRSPERDHRLYLEQTRELLEEGEVDLVVWPETVHTRGLLRPLPLSGRLIRGGMEVPLLLGAATIVVEDGVRRKRNSALLIGADGVVRDAYDKNVLIPFTERLPFADLVPLPIAARSEFSPGRERPALRFGPWRVSTPICHEAAQPAHVRRMVQEGRPHLLATLANDSWFGDSQEPWMHLAMARLRAVEHRRYLVRATNSGISAVIDPLGRDVARSGLLVRENLRAVARPLEGTTLYTRRGDWPGWLAAGALVLMLLWRRRAPDSPALVLGRAGAHEGS